MGELSDGSDPRGLPELLGFEFQPDPIVGDDLLIASDARESWFRAQAEGYVEDAPRGPQFEPALNLAFDPGVPDGEIYVLSGARIAELKVGFELDPPVRESGRGQDPYAMEFDRIPWKMQSSFYGTVAETWSDFEPPPVLLEGAWRGYG